ARELGEDPEVVSRHRGSELVGLRYTPPFDFFVGRPNAHRFFADEYVTTEDGTGIVHNAGAFGEIDKEITDREGIEAVVPVNARGEFTAQVPSYAGLHIFAANKPIIADLKAANLLLRQESYEHPYPHCWRCENPLMQRGIDSWFVRVTQLTDRMVELNEQINWVPEHIKEGQFGKWLANAIDWSISRNRYWGSPIPVWRSDDPAYPRTDVYGSMEELRRDFGELATRSDKQGGELATRSDKHGGELATRSDKHGGELATNLHRPMIDELTRPNPDDPTGRSTMRRVPEVLDCWFESGAMSFAQVHYPFENAEWFEHHYPGDFIVEYNGQTRGWFYTMHVLATALFDRPAFRNCLAHGIVLGDDGLKMSKSKGNYPEVTEVFDRDGSDAMRWFLMASPILRGGNLIVTERGIREAVRQSVLPLWNSWYFLSLYANAAGVPGRWRTDSAHVLDRYILAKTHDLVLTVGRAMDGYDISGACALLREFLEGLTNWYVRRSRNRFWAGEQDAVDTLHTVLEVTARVAAPLLPLTTEALWRGLTGERSVHLTDWPQASALPADDALVSAMDEVREVVSAALSLRKASKLRVRLPLARLTVAAPDAANLGPFTDQIRDEVNVKTVELTSDVSTYGRFELVVNARACGPRLGADVQRVIKAVKAGDWVTDPDGTVRAAGIALREGEYEQRLVAAGGAATAALPQNSGLVVLDTEVSAELAAEGVARDLIRVIQEARRTAGFEVSDRVAVWVSASAAVREAVRPHDATIRGETLADSVSFTDDVLPGLAGSVGDGEQVTVAVTRR
ncbi:MAG: class I tRNA ligase family protein, partial [Sciscionella sp.]